MFMPFVDEVPEGWNRQKVVPYNSPYILFWYFGGPLCDGRHRVCNAYVSLRVDADDERFIW
jgi:hypothetical protein